MWSKSFGVLAVACALCALPFHAVALSITDAELAPLSWNITPDPTNDSAGGSNYQVFGVGHAISGNMLYVVVRTNFPEAGVSGGDSYAKPVTFSPGDLYINVGGTFQAGTGTEYGVASTSHGNVVTQAYATWGSPVIAGRLYNHNFVAGSPMFADGTLERYQTDVPTFTPDDGDGNNLVNSYPTLIRFGGEIGDFSGVRWRSNGPDPWAYDIYYKIDLTALGYTGQAIQLFWTMECGNDGGQHFVPEIPEPTTMALLLTGVGVVAARKRRMLA